MRGPSPTSTSLLRGARRPRPDRKTVLDFCFFQHDLTGSLQPLIPLSTPLFDDLTVLTPILVSNRSNTYLTLLTPLTKEVLDHDLTPLL